MLRRHTIDTWCLSRVQAAQQTYYLLWRYRAGANHLTSCRNTGFYSVSNTLLLDTELLSAVAVCALEVIPEISSAAARASR